MVCNRCRIEHKLTRHVQPFLTTKPNRGLHHVIVDRQGTKRAFHLVKLWVRIDTEELLRHMVTGSGLNDYLLCWTVNFKADNLGNLEHLLQGSINIVDMKKSIFGAVIAFSAECNVPVESELVKGASRFVGLDVRASSSPNGLELFHSSLLNLKVWVNCDRHRLRLAFARLQQNFVNVGAKKLERSALPLLNACL